MNPQLEGIETLSGTYPFDIRASYRARKLNRFLWNLRLAEHRENFVADEDGAMRDAGLSDAEQDLVRRRDWLGLIKYGASFFVLEKIARVLKKLDPAAPHAVLLVLDATTGQNAISQVQAFTGAVPLTGLIMTKLDGTAKGGILVALADNFALPVHYIGVGEGEDDLQPFEARAFAQALTGANA